MCRLTVEPLLDFFTLVEPYVRGGWQQEDFEARVEGVLSQSFAELHNAGLRHDQVEVIYRTLVNLKPRLDNRSDGGERWELSPVPSASADPLEVLNYLSDVLEACVLPTRYLAWAVMVPLTIYWSALTRLQSSSVRRSNVGSDFTEAIDNWLSTVPIPPILHQLSEEAALEDLAQMSESVFANPRVREKVGKRFLDTYGNHVAFDLEAVLQTVDYLPTDPDTSEEPSMTNGLEIVDVEISPPRLEAADAVTGEREQWRDIAIIVRNRSEETLHAMSSVRTLNYDPNTRTLILGLSEPEADPNFPLIHKFPPALMAVPPGESVALRVSVPQVIKRLTTEFDVEEIDISNLERINCTVGYSDTAFQPEIEEHSDQFPGEQMQRQLSNWQATVEEAQEPKIARSPRQRRRRRGTG